MFRGFLAHYVFGYAEKPFFPCLQRLVTDRYKIRKYIILQFVSNSNTKPSGSFIFHRRLPLHDFIYFFFLKIVHFWED